MSDAADSGPDSDADADPDDEPVEATRTGPLGDLAATIDERRGENPDDSDSNASADLAELFEREDVSRIDSDRLWERLEADETAAGDAGDDRDREIREIDKATYCHQCEHFATPPAVGCTRDGTDILELTALETFRVADCPVVLEDEELEKRY